MADNTPQAGTDTIATDDIGGVKHPRVKLQIGADGSASDVHSANPVPTAGPDVIETTGTVDAVGEVVVAAIPAGYDWAIITVLGTSTWSSASTDIRFEGSTNGVDFRSLPVVCRNQNTPEMKVGSFGNNSFFAIGLRDFIGGVVGLTHCQVRMATRGGSDIINLSIRVGYGNPNVPTVATPVIGPVNTGAAPAGGPVYSGGFDNTNVRPIPITAKNTVPTGGYAVHVRRDVDNNRVLRTFFRRPTITTNAEVMASLTQYYNSAAVAATVTPAVVPAGKILRIESMTLTYMGVATAGGANVTLRANTSGTAVIGSPLVCEWFIGAAAGAGVTAQEDISFAEGMEFAAGTGIAVGVQGFSAAMAAAATGYLGVHIIAYEYPTT